MGVSAERTFVGFDVAKDRETFPILAGILISDFSKSWDGGVDIARIPSFGRSGLPMEMAMTWTTPVVSEICAGLEVTAYLTAEM